MFCSGCKENQTNVTLVYSTQHKDCIISRKTVLIWFTRIRDLQHISLHLGGRHLSVAAYLSGIHNVNSFVKNSLITQCFVSTRQVIRQVKLSFSCAQLSVLCFLFCLSSFSVLCLMLLVFLDCQFLIALSVFFNVSFISSLCVYSSCSISENLIFLKHILM